MFKALGVFSSRDCRLLEEINKQTIIWNVSEGTSDSGFKLEGLLYIMIHEKKPNN